VGGWSLKRDPHSCLKGFPDHEAGIGVKDVPGAGEYAEQFGTVKSGTVAITGQWAGWGWSGGFFDGQDGDVDVADCQSCCFDEVCCEGLGLVGELESGLTDICGEIDLQVQPGVRQ
jgi:hypothetical protein